MSATEPQEPCPECQGLGYLHVSPTTHDGLSYDAVVACYECGRFPTDEEAQRHYENETEEV